MLRSPNHTGTYRCTIAWRRLLHIERKSGPPSAVAGAHGLQVHGMRTASDRGLYTEVIGSLVDYLGGYQTLALILNVQVNDLCRWAEGKERPPTDVFLKIVDLANGERVGNVELLRRSTAATGTR